MNPHDEQDARRTDLPNGLRVYTRERPNAEVSAISISVRGGSRDEDEATVGAAHFMEHMFFQGTPRRPDSDAVFGPISALGGWLNAYTSFENINFQAVVRRQDYDLALDTLADMLVNSLFEEEKVDKERQVVLDELIRGKNDPRRYSVELFFKHIWTGHPAQNLPIGSRENLDRSTRPVLCEFRDRHFRSGNMVAAVVGNHRHEEVVEQIAAAFEHMPRGASPEYPSAPFPRAVRRTVTEPSTAAQAQLALGMPAPGSDHPDTYALDVLSSALGDVGRRFTRTIRDERGLAPWVGTSYSTLTDVGAWWAYTGTSVENVDPVIDLIVDELRKVREHGITEQELEDSKSNTEGRAVLGLQTSIAYAQYVADRECLGVDPPLAEYLRRLGAVTLDDVRRVARDYLDPEAYTLVVLRPDATESIVEE
jgi:predicted Zn-dependent peptidase